jgi:hypothetical protein
MRLNRRRVEQAPPFRRLHQAAGGDLVGGQAVDARAVEGNGPLARVHQARDGAERSGLAGAVGADEGHDLAGLHL